MVLLNREQSREIDRLCMEEYGVPGVILMENAARSVFDIIREEFEDYEEYEYHIFCYKGNNGGDGFALARHLYNHGLTVTVYFYSRKELLKGDALINYEIVEKMPGIRLLIMEDFDVPPLRQGKRMIVDSLLGTGLTSPLKGELKALVEKLNELEMSRKVAVDVPSGMICDDADSGGAVFHADLTVTMAYGKPGMYLYPNRSHTGKIRRAYISAVRDAVRSLDVDYETIDMKTIRSPKRFDDSHKGNYGKVTVIGGSRGMNGAGLLTSLSALKAGCGMVKWVCPPEAEGAAWVHPEIMCQPVENLREFLDLWEDWYDWTDVLAVGPGLGNREGLGGFMEELALNWDKPLIIDADGVNFMKKETFRLRKEGAEVAITPHPLEFSRLSGIPVREIIRSPIKYWKEFCRDYNLNGVLKTCPAIVGEKNGKIHINQSGNNGMSTAGSGDVLTGIIAGLAGQFPTMKDAVLNGVFLHGLSGDLAALKSTENGLTSSDIMKSIPEAFQFVMNKTINKRRK